MPITRSIRRIALLSCALSVGLLMLTASAAPAASLLAQLRVEGPTGTLDPGTGYVTDGGSFAKGKGENCTKASGTVSLPGATALGILADALPVTPGLSPIRVRPTDLGPFVCDIGGFRGHTNPSFAGWLYRVNHVSPSEPADTLALSRLDHVLWFYADYGSGANTGDELSLSAPVAAVPGQAFTVTVRHCDFNGNCRRANAAAVNGGPVAEMTDAQGEAQITPTGPGTLTLTAARGSDIPSNQATVCVNADLGNCPAARGLRIFGTAAGDRIRGTAGPDGIRSGAGADVIRARGGGRDRVVCGHGHDRARVDSGDLTKGCEVVIRG